MDSIEAHDTVNTIDGYETVKNAAGTPLTAPTEADFDLSIILVTIRF